jgi:hypothetical protein
MTALQSIPVGVIVERVKAESPWIDWIWRPAAVLAGEPETPPWTRIAETTDRTTFYAGTAQVDLHPSETANYRDNLATGSPMLWVVLRETGAEQPYGVYTVTADPAEGEGMTAAGNDIVEPVPMPDPVREIVEAFVARHHVDAVFVKRKRDRVNTEALGRRGPELRQEPREGPRQNPRDES